MAQLTVELDYTEQTLRRDAANELGLDETDVQAVGIIRRSIDARSIRGKVCFILAAEVEVADDAAQVHLTAWRQKTGVEIVGEGEQEQQPEIESAHGTQPVGVAKAPATGFRHRPVVVGAGPAGLLAAWRLAIAGANPILIERGRPVEDRRSSVGRFWSAGVLDGEDNVLYGEGGAGLYSDGKLTTRSKLRSHLRAVLELLVACGADESILIDAEPHLGSDRLGQIVPRLRERIIALGGEVRFSSRLDEIALDAGSVAGLVVNGSPIETSHCLLATGHSARDVYAMLQRRGVGLSAKPLAVGVRVEAPQGQIDASQFGRSAGHPRLGAASFRLTRRPAGGQRACYSFCMCPGGLVIACASAAGMLTTNGMSLSARSSGWGNAAFLVPVEPADFGGEPGDALAGAAWQGQIEAAAFQAGGGDYSLPACTLADFAAGRVSRRLPDERSCQRAVPADLHALLPPYVAQTLAAAVPAMLRTLRKVDLERALVYAAETRSSSPVRIDRDETFQSPTARGLYPVGEGAGYAGGIVTSAIDGLRAAEAMLQ